MKTNAHRIVKGSTMALLTASVLWCAPTSVQAAIVTPLDITGGSISLNFGSLGNLAGPITANGQIFMNQFQPPPAVSDPITSSHLIFSIFTGSGGTLNLPAPTAQTSGATIFGTTQMSPGTVVLQSSVPVKPISSLPSAAVLFGPVLIGFLAVILRQGASLKRPAAAISSSQVRPVPPTSPALILILSPDATFSKQTEEQLHRSDHPIRVVPSVEEIFAIASHTPVALVLVDPRASDWDMLRTDTTLRHVPMIALVPPGVAYTEENCQADLERGIDGVHYADEGHRLLLAKVGAYLRRAGVDVSRRGRYQVGSVELDTEVHEVKVGGQLVPLSAKPFVLLEAFMRAPSKSFSRTELVHLMWGPDFAIGEHTLDVHVHALRQLLDRDPNRLCRLMTIKGVGFKLKSFSLAMPASSVPNALPTAVNALPLLRTGVVHASNTQRSITSSTPSSRRTRLRPVPRQRRDRALRRKRSVRHLRSAVSVR